MAISVHSLNFLQQYLFVCLITNSPMESSRPKKKNNFKTLVCFSFCLCYNKCNLIFFNIQSMSFKTSTYTIRIAVSCQSPVVRLGELNVQRFNGSSRERVDLGTNTNIDTHQIRNIQLCVCS